LDAYIKKKETSQTNILTLYYRGWEKEQTKSKGSTRRDVATIRVQVNEIETRKTVEKINEAKGCFFFLKINKINKSIAKLKKRLKIINEKENISTDTT